MKRNLRFYLADALYLFLAIAPVAAGILRNLSEIIGK